MNRSAIYVMPIALNATTTLSTTVLLVQTATTSMEPLARNVVTDVLPATMLILQLDLLEALPMEEMTLARDVIGDSIQMLQSMLQ